MPARGLPTPLPACLPQVQNLVPNIKLAYDTYRQEDFPLYLRR
jgi:hypothetical protein